MTDQTPADELRAAAPKLIADLPGDLNATPHLVMTDAETVSGIAFCADHQLPNEFPHEYSACDNCAVIDCFHERLAELLLGLLLARQPLAAWLEDASKHAATAVAPHNQELIADPNALAFARKILGSAS